MGCGSSTLDTATPAGPAGGETGATSAPPAASPAPVQSFTGNPVNDPQAEGVARSAAAAPPPAASDPQAGAAPAPAEAAAAAAGSAKPSGDELPGSAAAESDRVVAPHVVAVDKSDITESMNLELAHDDPSKVVCGYLSKRGSTSVMFDRGFRDRYVVLDGGVLSYYNKESDYDRKKPANKESAIPLQHYAVVRGPDEGKSGDADLNFQLVPMASGKDAAEKGVVMSASGKPRVFVFRAGRKEDRDAWITCFRREHCKNEAALRRRIEEKSFGVLKVPEGPDVDDGIAAEAAAAAASAAATAVAPLAEAAEAAVVEAEAAGSSGAASEADAAAEAVEAEGSAVESEADAAAAVEGGAADVEAEAAAVAASADASEAASGASTPAPAAEAEAVSAEAAAVEAEAVSAEAAAVEGDADADADAADGDDDGADSPAAEEGTEGAAAAAAAATSAASSEADAESGEVIKEGSLNKKGETNSNWGKREVVVQGGTATYRNKGKLSKSARNPIKLALVAVVAKSALPRCAALRPRAAQRNKKLKKASNSMSASDVERFVVLKPLEGGSPFLFEASSAAEADEWAAAFKAGGASETDAC
ncbi:hypothetical protein FNF27_01990 [Cafeteria roenbergensis]|uniref:PH domain-containing protein n=2 Tax=Cafeteria roenbergensis TaxID=33653 RepID=A0A5A8EGM3_CAFRO|nr:hypothetical protein FNF27_01990 [Cafeteria roenbergensis]